MAYGYNNLGSLIQNAWIEKQKGGHMQFLTIQGLMIAWLTMIISLVLDLFPSLTPLRRIKRVLFMIALPVSVVVTTIYWSLILFMPHMILQANPGTTPPTSSTEAPQLMRIPLKMDLALHAAPGVSLLADFMFFERKYDQQTALYAAPVLAALSGALYGTWVEYLAKFNGSFPYPFLTENPFEIRVAIYTGAVTLALVSFWIINSAHP
ncbi:hypothetical protein GLOTRDRAFT_110070 [Gloeophyllum trabeum ATCC 11539]|uniref:FAR-17a/AIG1-like protein n=1 Tax=Gloeophyllum trabeum (strain ATCC 11539 / FP-39264 / Madison 617) TaxID=670483 RepID=S7RU17_GLOTA|nr:uncharacterized protein GLOTRDRAFT_110070 [Gloeophyllum trabeum ATCC 11539]EPQ58200.1 hypothetical protein GLOTRDRAFT_110070 [Gloeophyllum trabeum ATCC 11539]